MQALPAHRPLHAAAGQALPGQRLQPAQVPRQQQQATVETAVVGSIAATDFSSVAGLGEKLLLGLFIHVWLSVSPCFLGQRLPRFSRPFVIRNFTAA